MYEHVPFMDDSSMKHGGFHSYVSGVDIYYR